MRLPFNKATGPGRAIPPQSSPPVTAPLKAPSELMSDGWPATGLLRINQIIGPGRLPISKSQFWVLVRERGLHPVKVSPHVTCFYVHELREKLLGSSGPSPPSSASSGAEAQCSPCAQ